MRKIKQFIISYWTIPVEIGVVIWAVEGITTRHSAVWAYFFSAVLILYLTRRFKKKS